MERFLWSEQYETGETQVDHEHRELVRLINWVAEHPARTIGEATTRRVLDQLVRYALTHFAHEESLMRDSGCDPRFMARHCAVHQQFAAQVTRIRDNPALVDSLEPLLRFLVSWLTQHILGIDQSMARQIRRLRAGDSAADAYADESRNHPEPASASLIEALGALYGLVAERNDALAAANQGLEAQVAARTQALAERNAALRAEQERLQEALQQVAAMQAERLASEQRRAEASRRNLERHLEQIVDGGPIPTFVIDAGHRITHWNRACVALFGLAADDMIGTNGQWRPFYAQARPTMADLIVSEAPESTFRDYYAESFRPSAVIPGAYAGEAFFPGIGGGRWLLFTAAPLRDAAGCLAGAIETVQDVSASYEARERLLAHQSELERQVAARTDELAQANARLLREHTAMRELLDKYQTAQEQLLQSEKLAAIGQLAAGVAHEINNPVGFVSSNLATLGTYVGHLLALVEAHETVARGGDPARLATARRAADLDFLRDDLPALLAESREGLTRVTRIVQDLKDFSRVDQSGRQRANLNEALASTLNVVWNELKYKAEVVRELGDLPEIECVPAQINQVFMNLLVNAAQAIEQRGTITLRSGDSGDGVWFEIEDTGKGIPESVITRIFEPFFTTKPVGKGTGLGLSISYDIIVKRHGGRLDVRSQPGQGTVFRLWLPATPPAGLTDDQPAPPGSPAAASQSRTASPVP